MQIILKEVAAYTRYSLCKLYAEQSENKTINSFPPHIPLHCVKRIGKYNEYHFFSFLLTRETFTVATAMPKFLCFR